MSTETQTAKLSNTSTGFKTIFLSGLIAGILDGIAAMVVLQSWYKLSPAQVMQWIASGAYGGAAFAGGKSMVVAGVIIHFAVAYVLAIIYFYAFPKIKFLRTSTGLSGLLFGLAIWLIMNLLIIPVSRIQPSPFDLGLASVSIIWHMILVGLPIAFITKTHFAKKLSITEN